MDSNHSDEDVVVASGVSSFIYMNHSGEDDNAFSGKGSDHLEIFIKIQTFHNQSKSVILLFN